MTASLSIHYAPRTRSFTALWLLEELGQPYELLSFDLNTGAHKSPEFLAMNPMGKVPVVVHDGVPVSELGAIAIYLADRFPDAGLAPPADDPLRPAYLRWIFFASAIMEPALGEKFFKWEVPARSVAWGSYADMERTLIDALTNGGPYLLGEQFTAADVLVGAATRFGQMFGAMPKDGVLGEYVARVAERPACKRAGTIEVREGQRFPVPGQG